VVEGGLTKTSLAFLPKLTFAQFLPEILPPQPPQVLVALRVVEYLEVLAILDFETKEVAAGKVLDSLNYRVSRRPGRCSLPLLRGLDLTAIQRQYPHTLRSLPPPAQDDLLDMFVSIKPAPSQISSDSGSRCTPNVGRLGVLPLVGAQVVQSSSHNFPTGAVCARPCGACS
jgi:hypothetical protein